MNILYRLLLASAVSSASLMAHALPTPSTYLASLQFDGTDWFDKGEKSFPQAYRFNSYSNDLEKNKENYIPYAIGNNLYGTGSTGLSNRGPNDQRPAVYFNYIQKGEYEVYQYWLYYADNDWLNDHEHDWEKYFVYVKNGAPTHVLISQHDGYQMIKWSDMRKDGSHPLIGVDGGAHAMKNSSEDGVQISWNGSISKRAGTLNQGAGQSFAWVVYSHQNLAGTSSYTQQPDTFYYGDPAYSTNSAEYGDPRQAPWLRNEWLNPPLP
jgi:hypothetical protein